MASEHQAPDPEKLRSLITESGLSYRENSKSFIFSCPKCSKKDKLYIRKSDGQFVCWVCKETDNYKGRPEYVLPDLLGKSFQEVRAVLYGDHDLEAAPLGSVQIDLFDFFDVDEDEIEEDPTDSLPTLQWPHDFYPIDDPRAARGLAYLEQERGIPKEVAMEYHLRYCPPRRRIIFPVEVKGRLVGWQARSIIPTEYVDEEGNVFSTPKVLGSTGLKREVTLMFGDRLQGAKHAIVCEGPIDAIKCHLVGGAVATMGKAVSAAQLAALRQTGIERVYLALDPDAWDETMRLIQTLGDLSLYLLHPADGHKDLGEMTFEGVQDQFRKAERVFGGTVLSFMNTQAGFPRRVTD